MKALSEEQAIQLSIMLLQNDKDIKEELEKSIATKATVIGTTSDELSDIVIADNQLIYVQDKNIVALDINGNRKFLNQINIVDTDEERTSIEEPIDGLFYFVKETAVLWFYSSEWIQISSKPEDILYIGNTLPELGSDGKLYIDKKSKSISVWDDEQKKYVCVGDSTASVSLDDIDTLFTND